MSTVAPQPSAAGRSPLPHRFRPFGSKYGFPQSFPLGESHGSACATGARISAAETATMAGMVMFIARPPCCRYGVETSLLRGMSCGLERIDVLNADEHAVAGAVVGEAGAVAAGQDGPAGDVVRLSVAEGGVGLFPVGADTPDVPVVPVESL